MILWADGFDHYGDDAATMLDGPWAQALAAITTDQARTGAHSLQLGAGPPEAVQVRRVFGTPETSAGVAMAIYLPQLPGFNGGMTPIEFRDGANNCQARVCVESTGALAVYLGPWSSGVHAVATSTGLIRANGWNHLEAWIGVDDSAGWVEVRLNGVTLLNATAINTDGSGAGEVSQYATLNQFNRLSDGPWYIDDVVGIDDQGINNNSFIGDKKVFTDFPHADTADVDWTPSSGSTRYQMVDEAAPDDDATYDSASASDEVMGLAYPNVDGSVVTVAGVIFLHRSRKTDAGTCTLKQTAVSGTGSGEDDGAENAVTEAYSYYEDVFETDPSTGLAFDPTGVNGLTQLLTRTA